ncbi:MAG TPA: flagellar hook-length control protein FliK [Gemmobacter sp.]|nr:flagellar hook-length control protein FliK [Gemmobacter sp.]
MDIGSVIQGHQAAIPSVPDDRLSSTQREEEGGDFESFLPPEAASDPEAEALGPAWLVDPPARDGVTAPASFLIAEASVANPSEAAPVEEFLAVAELDLKVPDTASAGGGLAERMTQSKHTILNEEFETSSSTLSVGRSQSGAVARAGLDLSSADAALGLEMAGALPDPTALMSLELPAAEAEVVATGIDSDTPQPDTVGHMHDALIVPEDMLGKIEQRRSAETPSMTSSYWRLMLEGIVAHPGQGIDAAVSVTLQTPALAETLSAAEPVNAEARPLWEDDFRILAAAQVKAVAEGESLKVSILPDQPSSSLVTSENDAVAASEMPAIRQILAMPFADVALVGPDGVPLRHEGVQGLAGAGAAHALPSAEAGGADITLRAVQVYEGAGAGVTEIRLDPEELGRLRITLEGEGEGLRVRVDVERPETLDLLRRNGDRLAEILREAGYDQADMQFGSWSDGRNHADTRAAHDVIAELEPPAASSLALVPIARSVAMATGLNLRL